VCSVCGQLRLPSGASERGSKSGRVRLGWFGCSAGGARSKAKRASGWRLSRCRLWERAHRVASHARGRAGGAMEGGVLGDEKQKNEKKLPASPSSTDDNASTDVSLCATRKLAAGFGDLGAVGSGWWPPQGRHGPRLASASPGLCQVAGLMWPGGTGTAPIIGRRCWWPPQVAQVQREPSSGPVQHPAEPIANPRCNAQPELTRSHRSLAGAVVVSGLSLGGSGRSALRGCSSRPKQVGAACARMMHHIS
jgi:hypothetical protein